MGRLPSFATDKIRPKAAFDVSEPDFNIPAKGEC